MPFGLGSYVLLVLLQVTLFLKIPQAFQILNVGIVSPFSSIMGFLAVGQNQILLAFQSLRRSSICQGHQ